MRLLMEPQKNKEREKQIKPKAKSFSKFFGFTTFDEKGITTLHLINGRISERLKKIGATAEQEIDAFDVVNRYRRLSLDEKLPMRITVEGNKIKIEVKYREEIRKVLECAMDDLPKQKKIRKISEIIENYEVKEEKKEPKKVVELNSRRKTGELFVKLNGRRTVFNHFVEKVLVERAKKGIVDDAEAQVKVWAWLNDFRYLARYDGNDVKLELYDDTIVIIVKKENEKQEIRCGVEKINCQ